MARALHWVVAALLAAVGLEAVAADSPSTFFRPAPAFTARQLTTLPTFAWITNGGTLFNQRCSPLNLLNRETVGGLCALWRTGPAGRDTGRYRPERRGALQGGLRGLPRREQHGRPRRGSHAAERPDAGPDRRRVRLRPADAGRAQVARPCACRGRRRCNGLPQVPVPRPVSLCIQGVRGLPAG